MTRFGVGSVGSNLPVRSQLFHFRFLRFLAVLYTMHGGESSMVGVGINKAVLTHSRRGRRERELENGTKPAAGGT